MSRPRFRRVPHESYSAYWKVERWKPHPLFPWCGKWVYESGLFTPEQADSYVAHQMTPPHYYYYTDPTAPLRINTDGEPE